MCVCLLVSRWVKDLETHLHTYLERTHLRVWWLSTLFVHAPIYRLSINASRCSRSIMKRNSYYDFSYSYYGCCLGVLFIFFFLPLAFSSSSPNVASLAENFQAITHHGVQRTLDLTSPVLRELISVDVLEYDAKVYKDVLPYYIAVPQSLQGNLANAMVSLRGKLSTERRDWLYAVPMGMLQQDSTVLYVVQIPLSNVTEPGKLPLDIRLTYTHMPRPFPEYISINERQSVLCDLNYYFTSPYAIQSYRLTIVVPKDGTILSLKTKGLEPASRTANMVEYASHKKVEPFSMEMLTIHYQLNLPILNFERVVRTVQVSPWSSILSVEDEYTAENRGAKLKESFSRIDYQKVAYLAQTQQQAMIPTIAQLAYIFPNHVRGLDYRDEVGTISTSQVFHQLDRTILNIRPRYPLMGGWKASFVIRYRLPLSPYLRWISSGLFRPLSYTLTLPFFYSQTLNTSIDELVLKVVLPLGSRSIRPASFFTLNDQRLETVPTYVDSLGRPVLILSRRNVVEEHALPIFVSY
jgi:oligosaccharyltransferase complex subunit alpha (ribophorin I)